MASRVDSVRAFNRFVTRRAGGLDSGLLGTKHPLAEARLIFELAQHPVTEVSELRGRLELDSGHLSRLLARLETQGLVSRERSDLDGRRQVARLTGPGSEAFALLDRRSSEQAGELLASLSEADQRRLVGAMDAVRDLLGARPAGRSLVLRGPSPGTTGGSSSATAPSTTPSTAGTSASRPWSRASSPTTLGRSTPGARRRGSPSWTGGGRAACCAWPRTSRRPSCDSCSWSPGPAAAAWGARLVEECLRFARRRRYARVTLWTNDVLTAARPIYETAGFRLVYEAPHEHFGQAAVGQHWQLDL